MDTNYLSLRRFPLIALLASPNASKPALLHCLLTVTDQMRLNFLLRFSTHSTPGKCPYCLLLDIEPISVSTTSHVNFSSSKVMHQSFGTVRSQIGSLSLTCFLYKDRSAWLSRFELLCVYVGKQQWQYNIIEFNQYVTMSPDSVTFVSCLSPTQGTTWMNLCFLFLQPKKL